jgi:hypothetical protein
VDATVPLLLDNSTALWLQAVGALPVAVPFAISNRRVGTHCSCRGQWEMHPGRLMLELRSGTGEPQQGK